MHHDIAVSHMPAISTELFLLSHNPFLVDLPRVLYRMHSQLGKQGKHFGSLDVPSRTGLYTCAHSSRQCRKRTGMEAP